MRQGPLTPSVRPLLSPALLLVGLLLPPPLASQQASPRLGGGAGSGPGRAAGPAGGQEAGPQGPGSDTGPEGVVPPDLRSVLDVGRILQDRNGDGVVDYVDGRILFSTHPTEAEVAAAANLAARLGYETSAADLGMAGRVDARRRYLEPVILVGVGAVEGSGLANPGDPLRGGLVPGQGILAHFPEVGPFASGAVAVAGYDATGLLSAASYLSGRYPEVWDPTGITWKEVAKKVEAFVGSRAAPGNGAPRGDAGSPAPSVTLDRIVVDGARPGVTRARVTVRVEDGVLFDVLLDAFLGRDTLAADSLPSEAEEDVVAARGDSLSRVGRAGSDARDDVPTLADLEFKDLHRLDVRLLGPERVRALSIRPRKPWNTRPDEPYRRPGDDPFSLADFYSVGGLFRDTNRDLVADETVGYLSLSGTDTPDGTVDLATRIGLETAGIRLPLAGVGAREDDPTGEGFPILLGSGHDGIRRLAEEGKLATVSESAGGAVSPSGDPVLPPGVGFVELVDEAFGERGAMAVGGGDGPGVRAAVQWLARRVPYLWTHGKGEYRLADAQTEIRRFLQAREGPGQVALALTKLEAWLDRMARDPSRTPEGVSGDRTSEPTEGSAPAPPARVEVELAASEIPEGLDGVVGAAVRSRFPDAVTEVSTFATGFGVGDTIFAVDWEIPWEVDDARRILAEEVYPALEPGRPAEIELRVSESPEIRASLEAEIRRDLAARGIPGAAVRVLSAYKQGYSWIHDVLLPRLRGTDVASVRITYHTLEESEEVRWQTIAAETRWLQEVFPIDAVLARELGIPDSVVTFHPTRERDPIYTFEAFDPEGEVILRERFTPKYVVRPFFDLFPEYEQVRVTTGWIRATSGGELVMDRRIATDPERFWDRLQTEAFGEIVRYVMDSQDGDPSGDNAPFFDEFRVDLRLSEPDYRIGVDEEAISSLEALHEDIFFETHTLFSLLGGRYQTSLSYPGRVLPFMDPGGQGRPGRARLVLTGKSRGDSELILRSWTEGGTAPTLRQYSLDPLPVDAPRVVGATLTAGREELTRLLARVTVSDSLDRFQEFQGRGTEEAIDRQFVSVELLEGMIATLGRLHDAGLFEDVLAWDRIAALALDFRLDADSTFRRVAVLPRSAGPGSTDNPRLDAGGWTFSGEPLVQWDTPIPPEENEEILARLATFPGVHAYYLTDSYLGHRVWAADFLPPQDAEYVSQAKLNALKPTLFISGREHANEVSSTSHVLRLGELLVTDSAHMELLKKVNVVLHPMTNPDGAELAYDRWQVNPTHMLHAARPGALGVDATSGGRNEDPVYPEARARHMIQEAWLPDIYLNPHGYPSHEWVQYFAGYSAWVRSRRGGARDWWVPRSWFIPGFSWVDDEENPDYKEAQFAILDTMAAAMTADPEVEAANRRLYARYRKYEVQDREGFTEYFHNGMLVNMRLRGAESIGNGLYSPRITYFSVTTEAPDEPSQGEWMRLMGKMGLAHTSSALRYLATGRFEVEREAEAFGGSVTRKTFRVKPVLPLEEDPGGEGEGKAGGG